MISAYFPIRLGNYVFLSMHIVVACWNAERGIKILFCLIIDLLYPQVLMKMGLKIV